MPVGGTIDPTPTQVVARPALGVLVQGEGVPPREASPTERPIYLSTLYIYITFILYNRFIVQNYSISLLPLFINMQTGPGEAIAQRDRSG